MNDHLTMEQRATIANAALRTSDKIEGAIPDGTLFGHAVGQAVAARAQVFGWRIFAEQIMNPARFSFALSADATMVVAQPAPETPRQFITAAVAAFRDYEQQHLLKDPPATEKAEANARMADRGERLLASWAASEN